MKLHLHHVAVLTGSLSAAEASLPPELKRLEVNTFPGEGTKEQYIELFDPPGPSLLLMEPVGDGPYRRALQKRGSGLHHFGLFTDSINDAVNRFASRGLLLHPITLKTRGQGVVWMCRPGVPFLVEIVAAESLEETEPPLFDMAIPGVEGDCIQWIPGVSISRSDDPTVGISTGAHSFRIRASG